jgi:hypothetical protein
VGGHVKTDVREMGGVVWTSLIWLRIGTSGELYEHGNEPYGSINFWEVLE